MKRIIVVALALLVNVCTFAYEPFWKEFNKTFDVKGGVGIEQFLFALDYFSPDYVEAENFDKKNGYFSSLEEGDGHCSINACYWNRSDGKKLFIISYDYTEYELFTEYEPIVSQWGYCNMEEINDNHGYIHDTGCMAYLYDETSKQLVPMATSPFLGLDLDTRKHYFLELPQQGKDIKVSEMITWNIRVDHTLKWNGKTFDFVKSDVSLVELYRTETEVQGGGVTNIRNAPNGKVVDGLTAGLTYSMFIDKVQNGWCHIYGGAVCVADNENSEYVSLAGDVDDYWIHNSVIGASGVGAGGVTLRKSPDVNAAIVFENDNYTFIHLLEIKGDWVKVYDDKTKTQGWMLKSEICSNPLTSCS